MTMPGTDPRVLLIGRAGCHLCEVARETVAAVCAETGATWREIDVTTDPALVSRYGEYVPVTIVDGAQLDFWRVDADRLRTALATGA